ncbi:MAG: hypothetical protein COW42_15065 [Deltaproteobacteria bacterium CG17_big_fil_post_rev_8_21_14_2_50_63_7]|nr:MAG: hypothetical protein COW42_15065 [Deltaproteobacteria bacterium CG17_big_fil_post_rev_8_21_14_2_50_63_7]
MRAGCAQQLSEEFDMELQQLKSLLDILMAAAAIDGHTALEERKVIQDYLEEMGLIDADQRTELESHRWSFDPEFFHLEAAVKGLGRLGSEERVKVIKLLERVEEADGVIDIQEADFIQRVASKLGANPDEIEALTVEIIEMAPPPLPKH